jgi:hypothetical protein
MVREFQRLPSDLCLIDFSNQKGGRFLLFSRVGLKVGFQKQRKWFHQ